MKKIILTLILSTFALGAFAVDKLDKNLLYSDFKATYDAINSAYRISVAKNGLASAWDWGLGEDEVFDKYLKPYLQIAKTCEKDDTSCWGTNAYMSLNTHAAQVAEGLHKTYILANGASILFESRGEVCLGQNGGRMSSCAFIWFDTNGSSAPNTTGRDFFKLYIYPTSNQIYPVGYHYKGLYDAPAIEKSCNSMATGNYCGAKLLIDKVMNY